MFNEKERRIFKYFNGVKDVLADPIGLYRTLMSEQFVHDLGLIDLLSSAVTDGDNKVALEGLQAWGRSIDVLRTVFKVSPFSLGEDGETAEGLTEEETMLLFRRFLAFLDDKKKEVES